MNPAEETPSPSEVPSPVAAVEQIPPATESSDPPSPVQSGEAARPTERRDDGPRDRGGRGGRGQGRGGGPRRDSAAHGTVDNPEPAKSATIHASGRKLRRLIDEDLGDE